MGRAGDEDTIFVFVATYRMGTTADRASRLEVACSEGFRGSAVPRCLQRNGQLAALGSHMKDVCSHINYYCKGMSTRIHTFAKHSVFRKMCASCEILHGTKRLESVSRAPMPSPREEIWRPAVFEAKIAPQRLKRESCFHLLSPSFVFSHTCM